MRLRHRTQAERIAETQSSVAYHSRGVHTGGWRDLNETLAPAQCIGGSARQQRGAGVQRPGNRLNWAKTKLNWAARLLAEESHPGAALRATLQVTRRAPPSPVRVKTERVECEHPSRRTLRSQLRQPADALRAPLRQKVRYQDD